MTDFTTLELSIEGAVARIWLNRPELRNAFDDVVIAELTQAFIEAGSAPQVRAVVLGANGPAFCAGFRTTTGTATADSTFGRCTAR